MCLPFPDVLENRSYFFDQGLCFACQQCGACCVGDPGTIYVTLKEIISIAVHLKMSVADFSNRYLYSYKDSYSIGEDEDGDCLFYNQGCTIYSIRPLQCRTFPFWFSNLRSENRWQRVQGKCPGIGKGRRYTKKEILDIARTTLKI